ncbi:bile acid:sodium symporter [Streptomyces sp. NBC_01190]|nr:bile acid:sodium symporter [Streptomyces sp. NBC_01190]
MPVDPYIAALAGTVVLAALLPATGAAAAPVGSAANAAVALLFFLYGARLSTRQAWDGLRHWRLHLTILTSTFVLFPLLGLAARGLVPYLVAPQLYPGLLYLCVLPTTVQSAIAFTAIARGNVPAAICAGTYSSLLGLVITPLLAVALLGSAAVFSADRLIAVATQLLLPFLAGHLLRRWIGPFVDRRPRTMGLVDRGSVLLVVYTAFSQGMAQGIWHRVTLPRLIALLVVEAALLALVLATTGASAAALGFARDDRIAIVFSGSKKSLVNGLPMAAVLFGAKAGLTVLPLMLFHQMQLIVCAVIAKHWSSRHPGDSPHQGTDAAALVP